jgi:hypothetical protein
MPEPSQTDWAYLAGIIDGEGCISLFMGSNGYPHARIQVANNKMVLHNHPSEIFKAHTTHWADCPTIAWILENTLPYYIIKRNQAELLLEYARNSKGQGKKNLTSPERLIIIVDRLKELHSHERRSE